MGMVLTVAQNFVWYSRPMVRGWFVVMNVKSGCCTMISPVIESHATVMPRKCVRETILTVDSLALINPL
jgi:hypothetical protein